jgi:hypothetical protein
MLCIVGEYKLPYGESNQLIAGTEQQRITAAVKASMFLNFSSQNCNFWKLRKACKNASGRFSSLD